MGSKVCGTPEMMGGWPGALVALSHLRLDSEGWESDGGLLHRGMCLHTGRLHTLVQRHTRRSRPTYLVTLQRQMVLIISQIVFASQ